jgi:hypothetical protein
MELDNLVTIPIDSARTTRGQRIRNLHLILRSAHQTAICAHHPCETSEIEVGVAFVQESAAGCVEKQRAMEDVHASQGV